MRCGGTRSHWRLRGIGNGPKVFLERSLELTSVERNGPPESTRLVAVVRISSRNLVTHRAKVRLIRLTPPHLAYCSCASAAGGMVRSADHSSCVFEYHVRCRSYCRIAHRILGIDATVVLILHRAIHVEATTSCVCHVSVRVAARGNCLGLDGGLFAGGPFTD